MPKLEPTSSVAPNLAGNKDPASIGFFFFEKIHDWMHICVVKRRIFSFKNNNKKKCSIET
jgi:hypothetical protein